MTEFHGVKTDETGLHAVDCDCATCDRGYRPTELERAAARRALALRLADEARRAALVLENKPKVKRWGPPGPPRPVAPLTAEQWEELKQLRKGIGK